MTPKRVSDWRRDDENDSVRFGLGWWCHQWCGLFCAAITDQMGQGRTGFVKGFAQARKGH